MMMLLPCPERIAMSISESMDVFELDSQFCAGMPKNASTWLKSPSGEESYSHSHTTESATPEATPGR